MSNPSYVRSVTATASYASLPALAGTEVSILNNTGAVLDIQFAGDTGSGKEINLDDGQSVRLKVIASAAEIQIKSATGTTGVEVVIDS